MQKYYITILVLLITSSCGGGGSSDNTIIVSDVNGRWTGTLSEDKDRSCSPNPNPQNLDGKAYTLEVSVPSNFKPSILDQNQVLYRADTQIADDNSFDTYSLNQNYIDGPEGPTSIFFLPNNGTQAEVEFLLVYNRFCTSYYKGTFTKLTDGSTGEPPFLNINGSWKGSLPLIEDECNLKTNPLQETHTISFNNTDINLVSTDRRILTGSWKTLTSFSADILMQIPPNFVKDTVEYDNVSETSAIVTVTREDGNMPTDSEFQCTTVWRGEMRKD